MAGMNLTEGPRMDLNPQEYLQKLRLIVAAMPGGEAGFLEQAKRPGYAAGVGLAAVSGMPEEVRAKHEEDLVSLAGQPGYEVAGDGDETLGQEFLENLRLGMSAGGALWMEQEVLARWTVQARERGTTLLGLMGSMANTFKQAQRGFTRF
jgi:hypothetical protein